MKRERKRGRRVWLMVLAGLVGGVILAAVGISSCSRDRRPNVILVIIDTLPAGHVSSYGYERSTTPNLDRVAAEGIRFVHAVAPSPWTMPSVASILTGTFPSRHRAGLHLDPPTQEDRRLSRMRPDLITLADLFRDHGYQTVGFFNNPFVHPDSGLNQGFDEYNYVEGDNLTIRTAAMMVAEAVQWLEQKRKKPFFMVLHFFDPHLAYNPSLPYAMPYIADYRGSLTPPFNPVLEDIRAGKVSYSEEDRRFIIGLYDAEVAETDAQLGLFLDYLKEKGLYDSSLLILTSDHGEEFWEHGGFEHGHSLHREVIEVPLVFRFPGGKYGGQVVEDYVSLCDIFPTIAEFMGWQIYFPLDGVSLFPKAGRVVVPRHNIVSENLHYGPQKQCLYADNFKLIVNIETGRLEVYDLRSDPGETKNIFGEITLPDRLKSQIKKMAADLEAALKAGPSHELNLDPETLNKLRALGYFSSGGPTPGAAGTTTP